MRVSRIWIVNMLVVVKCHCLTNVFLFVSCSVCLLLNTKAAIVKENGFTVYLFLSNTLILSND